MVAKGKRGRGEQGRIVCAAAGAAGGTLVEMNALCLDCGQWCHRDDILYFLKMLSWGKQGKESRDISVIFLAITCESTVSQHNI